MSAIKGLCYFILLVLVENAQFITSEPVAADAGSQKQGCKIALTTKSLFCYYSGIEPLSSIDPCLCTHLILEGATLSESGKLLINSDDLLSVKILRARNPSLSVIASIGSKAVTKSNFTSLTTLPEVQKVFIDSVVDYFENDSINGIEINWHWPIEAGNAKKHRQDLTQFTKELFAYFRENLILVREERSVDDISINGTESSKPVMPIQTEGTLNLTIFDTSVGVSTAASPSSKEVDTQTPLIILRLPVIPEVLVKGYDLKALTRSVDLFVVTTHNMTNSGEAAANLTYHHSRLMGEGDIQNVDSVIDLLVSLGVPIEKIIPAVPTFGEYFRLKNSTENTPNSPAVSSPSVLSFRQICSILKNGEWTVEREEDLTGAYAFKEDQWVAFDDDTTARIKAKYFLLRGLPGAAVFYIDMDDMQATCGKDKYPVVKAVQETLNALSRSRRRVVLESLEEDLLTSATDTRPVYYNNVKLSEYRIVRVVDRSGYSKVHREATETTLTCSRQGYYRHPESCNYFYRCVKFNQYTDDFTVFQYECPEGLVFDEKWEICTYPSQTAPCDGSSEIQPVPKSKFICPSEGYFADPENCRWFFACKDYSGYGELTQYEFRCPFGLVFDAPNLRCNWPWMVEGCGKGSYQPSYPTTPYPPQKYTGTGNYNPSVTPPIIYNPGSNIVRKEPGAPGYLLGKVIASSSDGTADVKSCVDCSSGEIRVGGGVTGSVTPFTNQHREEANSQASVQYNKASDTPKGQSYVASSYTPNPSYPKPSTYNDASLSNGEQTKVYGQRYPNAQDNPAYSGYPSNGEKYQSAPSYPSPYAVPASAASEAYGKTPAYLSHSVAETERYKPHDPLASNLGHSAYGQKDHSGEKYADKDYPAPLYAQKDYPAPAYIPNGEAVYPHGGAGYSAHAYASKDLQAPAYVHKDYPASPYDSKNYPASPYDSKNYPAAGYASKDYPAPAYASKDYPAPAYASKDYPAPAYASKNYPAPTYANINYPAPAYASKEYAAPAYVHKDYPAPTYVSKEYPAQGYIAKEYPAPSYVNAYPVDSYSGKDPSGSPAKNAENQIVTVSADPSVPVYNVPAPSYSTPSYNPVIGYNAPASYYPGYISNPAGPVYDKNGPHPAVQSGNYPKPNYPEVPFRESTYNPPVYSAVPQTYPGAGAQQIKGYPEVPSYPKLGYKESPYQDSKQTLGTSLNSEDSVRDTKYPGNNNQAPVLDGAAGQPGTQAKLGSDQSQNHLQASADGTPSIPHRQETIHSQTPSNKPGASHPTPDGVHLPNQKAEDEKVVYVKVPKPLKPSVLKKFSDRNQVELPTVQDTPVPNQSVEPEFGSIQDIQGSGVVAPALVAVPSNDKSEEPEFGEVKRDKLGGAQVVDGNLKNKAIATPPKKQPSGDSSRTGVGKKKTKPSSNAATSSGENKTSGSAPLPTSVEKSAADQTVPNLSEKPSFDRHEGSSHSYKKPVVGGAFGFKPLNETLSTSLCTRPGLFRHPNDCRKFYECFYDRWINKYTLHVFSCPIKLVYDEEIYACNWPFQGPQCVPNQPLEDYEDNKPFVSVVSV